MLESRSQAIGLDGIDARPERDLRVVVADDHDMFRQGLVSLLKTLEHIEVVGQAKDGEQALVEIKRLEPDLALLDVSMPKLNGLEVCRNALSAKLDTAFVILTMHDDLLLAQEAFDAGAEGFLLKDNTFDEVAKAIDRVSRGKGYVSDTLRNRLQLSKHEYQALSERELEVLTLLAKGETVKNIAAKLDVSTSSIDTYRTRITRKLNLKTSAELIQYAITRALI